MAHLLLLQIPSAFLLHGRSYKAREHFPDSCSSGPANGLTSSSSSVYMELEGWSKYHKVEATWLFWQAGCGCSFLLWYLCQYFFSSLPSFMSAEPRPVAEQGSNSSWIKHLIGYSTSPSMQHPSLVSKLSWTLNKLLYTMFQSGVLHAIEFLINIWKKVNIQIETFSLTVSFSFILRF